MIPFERSRLGFVIGNDARRGRKDKLVERILASDWLADIIADAEERGRQDGADARARQMPPAERDPLS